MTDAEYITALNAKCSRLECELAEAGAQLEWISNILDGKNVSEFAESFSLVRDVMDLIAEREALRLELTSPQSGDNVIDMKTKGPRRWKSKGRLLLDRVLDRENLTEKEYKRLVSITKTIKSHGRYETDRKRRRRKRRWPQKP